MIIIGKKQQPSLMIVILLLGAFYQFDKSNITYCK